MVFSKSFIGKFCLFLFWWTATIAVPITELVDEIETRENVTYIMKREAGDSASDPVNAEFDITGWENIAEEDCFVMLCLRGGNRV